MKKFNWGMDILVPLVYNKGNTVEVVDVESKLQKMTEFKEAMQVIDKVRKTSSDK